MAKRREDIKIEDCETPADFARYVKQIRRVWDETGDYEKCHGMEDVLHAHALRVIKLGRHPNGMASNIAEAALKSLRIPFDRIMA